MQSWTEKQVQSFLQKNNLQTYCSLFALNKIDGEALLLLDHQSLKDLGISSLGHRVKLLKLLNIKSMSLEERVSQLELTLPKDRMIKVKFLNNVKSIKVSSNDPINKVLSVAAKKFNVSDKNYSLYSNGSVVSDLSESVKILHLQKKQLGFAVCIFEYKKSKQDELTVSIGDKVKVLAQNEKWFIVEDKQRNQGMIPMDCVVMMDDYSTKPYSPPLLVKALYEYEKGGPNEISVKKGDLIQVKRQFNHWLLAESGGREGFIPMSYTSMESEVTLS